MSEARSFGRYRVTGNLGAGAMGEVLSAVDELLGREVAVKTLRGRSTGLAARMADERFRLEARAIAQLTHPSVVQVYDLDLTADPPYLVMERVAGPSLKERLEGGPLPEHEVRALGIQIANALATAHARGIVHRDVKPANILGAGPGTWKLADFGVAHVPDSSLTLTGQFVGSPAYAAPEALLRGQLGPEGDVFGLGATLYQAAAGTWPRADAEVKGLLAPVAPIRSLAPGVAPDIAAAIDRAVAVEPTARPSAAELALALAGGSAGPGLAAVSLPAPGAPVTPPPAAALPGPASSGNLSTAAGVPAHGWPTPVPSTTVSVPDWPAPGASGAGSVSGWQTAGASGPGATSPGATSPGVPTTTTPAAGTPAVGASPLAKTAAGQRWKHAVAGIATVLVIGLIAATRCSGSKPPGTVLTTSPGGAAGGGAAPAVDDSAPRRAPPETIQARTPQVALTSKSANKDWNKVVEKLYDQQLGEARRKLAEFETKHGATPETRDLASQLDAWLEHYPQHRDDD